METFQGITQSPPCLGKQQEPVSYVPGLVCQRCLRTYNRSVNSLDLFGQFFGDFIPGNWWPRRHTIEDFEKGLS